MEKIFNIRYLSRCYVLSTSTTNTNTTLKLKIEEDEYKKNVTFPTSDDGYCFLGHLSRTSRFKTNGSKGGG